MFSKHILRLGEVPDNVFVDDCITIPVYLVDEANKLCRPREPFSKVAVRSRIVVNDTESRPSCSDKTYKDMNSSDTAALVELADSNLAPAFDVEEDSCFLGGDGVGTLRVIFRQLSMNFENRKFVLCVCLENQTRRDMEATPAQTTHFFVISQKLVLMEENKSLYTWRKDEGSKQKCIVYRVSLVDRHGKIVVGKKVALKLTLLYKSGQIVPHQNIMMVHPDSELMLNGHQEYVVIRVRINEVSTRHMGQPFQVLIEPDIAVMPSTADVCPVLSVPVEVRSKRNNRATAVDDDNMSDISENPRKKSLRSSERSSRDIMRSEPTRPDYLNNQTSFQATQSRSISSGPSRPRTDPVTVADAIEKLTAWAEIVIEGLESIQWERVGYAMGANGRPDLNKPLFNIPNPHTTIAEIIEGYLDHAKPSLSFLSGMVDEEAEDNRYRNNNDRSAASTVEPSSRTRDNRFLNLVSCVNSLVSEDANRDGKYIFL
jgi:hypothetical protein